MLFSRDSDSDDLPYLQRGRREIHRAGRLRKAEHQAAQTGYVDFIDVEIFTGDAIVTKIIDGAHAAGVKVIASNHDFHKTPEKSDIIYRLRKMQDMNADIPKIAVMPQNKKMF